PCSTSGPNSRAISASPGLPGATTSRASASASITGRPRRRKCAATVLLPEPSPPVRPNTRGGGVDMAGQGTRAPARRPGETSPTLAPAAAGAAEPGVRDHLASRAAGGRPGPARASPGHPPGAAERDGPGTGPAAAADTAVFFPLR